MSQPDEFDRLVNPDPQQMANYHDSSNPSLDNNKDDFSYRNDQDLDVADFLQNSQDLKLKPELYDQDNISLRKIESEDSLNFLDKLFLRATQALSRRNDSNEFAHVLRQLLSKVEDWWADRLATYISLLMSINSSAYSESAFFVKALIFIKDLLEKFQTIKCIQKYRGVVAELLRPKAPFYSINLSQENIQIIELYLSCDEVEEDSLNTVISEHFALEQRQTTSHLYQFLHDKVLMACYRENAACLLLNCLVISRAPSQQVAELLQKLQVGVWVQDYAALDKKQLEEYSGFVVQMASGNEQQVESYIFRLVLWLLEEKGQMERKILGFKVLSELVATARLKPRLSTQLLNWLVSQQLIEKFVSDSTHARILQQLQPLLHFLYDNNLLTSIYLTELMKQSLHSEDILKVVQSMLGWLRLEHLEDAFELITVHPDRDSPHFNHFLNALIANPAFSPCNHSRRRKNYIIQDNRRDWEPEIQSQGLEEKALSFVRKLLKFLIQLTNSHQSIFMPTLLKLISTHLKVLRAQIQSQILHLLRSNSPSSLWILEHCLKLETAQERGQGKYEMMGRLTAQGVWQLLQALLARNRYSRAVVQKALSVIILLCRFQRPLQRTVTEFLWKVLALTGRDERQREQFFVFLKEIVRFEGAVSEQSVNYIFFDLLMALGAEWFSLRVYDCLEMLFLRLNEDCKLVTFQKDHYSSHQPLLIGGQKFWYIYFNCNDLKVVRKCRDFLWKLATYSKCQQEALALVDQQLRRQLALALQLEQQHINKQQILIFRGFQIVEKMLQQKETKEDNGREGIITLHIQNNTPECLGERHKSVQFNQKLTLSDLRGFIGDNLNPPVKNIDLINKGKLLKGENLSLRELKLQNNETLIVSRSQQQKLSQTIRDQKKNKQLQQLTGVFGCDLPKEFLAFVVDKYEGQEAETIANYLFDPQRVQNLKEQFNLNKQQIDQVIEVTGQQIEIMDVQKKTKKFGDLLVESRQGIEFWLSCLKVSQNRRNAWALIKRLPLNREYVQQVEECSELGDWNRLFQQKNLQQTLYCIHILTNLVRHSPAKASLIFVHKNLVGYLVQWLQKVAETGKELQNHEDLLKLVLLSLSCPLLAQFESFVTSKKTFNDQQQLLNIISQAIDQQLQPSCQLKATLCKRLVDCLLEYSLSDKMAAHIIKLYLYQLHLTPQPYHILTHPQLQALLLKYGRPLHFAVVATAVRQQKSIQNPPLSDLALQCLAHFKKLQQIKSSSSFYGSFFACLNSLLTIAAVQDSSAQLQALYKILSNLKNSVTTLLEQQIIGYLKISLKLFNRHLKTEHGERRNDSLSQFAVWLFNDYLFGLKQPLPFFKNKLVRKAAYELLVGLCAYPTIRKAIISCIRGLVMNFTPSNRQDGQFRSAEFVGMKNLGATCYINSLLQQLYHTILPKLLLEQDTNDNPNPVRLPELKKIFANLYCGARTPVSTREYVATVKMDGVVILPMVQQDVNEYFVALMHEIETVVGRKAIDQTICGSVVNQITSMEDRTSLSNVQESFLTLMIEMKGKRNLVQALTALTRSHTLEGENIYFSESLNRNIRANSKISLSKLPSLLVITLKRFYWNFETMTRHKINDYFQFPLELDVARFTVQKIEHEAQYYQYRLCGILIHSGSAQSGHYYSYIRAGQRWLEFNDKKVTEWDLQNNLKNQCFGGSEERSRNAYMLFYQKVGSMVHGASLHQLPPDNKVLHHVETQNRSFVLNRLVYDCHYVEFIKQLAVLDTSKSLQEVLQKLNLPNDHIEPLIHFPQVEDRTSRMTDSNDVEMKLFSNEYYESIAKEKRETSMSIVELVDEVTKRND